MKKIIIAVLIVCFLIPAYSYAEMLYEDPVPVDSLFDSSPLLDGINAITEFPTLYDGDIMGRTDWPTLLKAKLYYGIDRTYYYHSHSGQISFYY